MKNNDHVVLETTDDEHLDPWRCEECGSTEVEQKVWADPNTLKVIAWDSAEGNDLWCRNCGAHTKQILESELIKAAEEWWDEQSTDEKISTYIENQ